MGLAVREQRLRGVLRTLQPHCWHFFFFEETPHPHDVPGTSRVQQKLKVEVLGIFDNKANDALDTLQRDAQNPELVSQYRMWMHRVADDTYGGETTVDG